MRWVPHRNARDSARVRAGARPGASGSIESMDVLFDIPLAALPVPCALAAFALAACVFAWAGVVDAARRIVPNAAVLAGVGIWCAVFAAAAASADAGPLRRACFAGLAGALAAAGFSGACACVLSRVSGRAALGMGDVKLLFAAGLFLGAAGALVCLGPPARSPRSMPAPASPRMRSCAVCARARACAARPLGPRSTGRSRSRRFSARRFSRSRLSASHRDGPRPAAAQMGQREAIGPVPRSARPLRRGAPRCRSSAGTCPRTSRTRCMRSRAPWPARRTAL